MQIHLDGGRSAFAPGESVSGTLQWMGDAAPERVELRLLWYTEGRGDQDVGVARTLCIEAPGSVGSSPFDFEAPSGPHSCAGRLISVRWALEAIVRPGSDSVRQELVVAPGGSPVELGEAGVA